ncbi:hypothetical protein [Pseudooceanicola nitratireducens]|uniref:hypothetical protein n=1 Tax=Pseudooceanicola nitratireducens TaxID=517719 RepID=UPI003C7D8947
MRPAADPRMASAADLLAGTSQDAQLLQLRNLVINNGGIWTVPDCPTPPRAVLFEVALFGVSAVATSPAELPQNWCRAARAIAAT